MRFVDFFANYLYNYSCRILHFVYNWDYGSGYMIDFCANIKRLRESRSLNQNELGEKLGVSGKTVSSWEIGRTEPDIGTIDRIAKLFSVSVNELMYEVKETSLIHYINIPLYQSLCCGSGMFVEDAIEEYIQISDRLLNPSKNYFAQVANGDSMIGENINDGDVLIFEKTQHIENGQVGCFCVDDNMATCKKFYKDNDSNIIMLHPANSEHQPIIVTVENMAFHVVGKLKLVINKR